MSGHAARGLVLCSDMAEVAGLVTEIGKVGVDIRIITTARAERNKLAAMVRMDKMATLPRMG